LADCRDHAHLAALKAVRGGELLHERRFALGQARPLQTFLQQLTALGTASNLPLLSIRF